MKLQTRMKDSIKLKILVSMTACIVLFTLVSGAVISILLGARLSERSRQINEQYLTTIVKQLNAYVSEINTLGAFCASSQNILYALNYHNLETLSARRMCLKAQESLDGLLASSPLSMYTTRLVVFNMENIPITATASKGHNRAETALLQEYARLHVQSGEKAPVYGWYSVPDLSSDPDKEAPPVLTCLYPLSIPDGYYMYMELKPELLLLLLTPYRGLQKIFLINDDCSLSYASFALPDSFDTGHLADGDLVTLEGDPYQISAQRVGEYGITVCILNERKLFAGDNLYIFYLLLLVLITTIAAALLIARIVTSKITRPIRVLTAHIRRITETNDFSFNPEIAASTDEIGAIGHAVNHMALHIQELLTRMEQMYEQRKNIEIALLQSQINPHFLYNTLDSIRWMAVIQKSKNIELTTKALENLLRNMAKGTGDKITLREELALVSDYVHIQKVRYVEVFDYICEVPEEFLSCLIIKFTLQPIVENAIFHGVEPTGEFGEITVRANGDDDSLFISIEDNGAGMTEAELQDLKDTLKNNNKDSLSGIGVANVDARLKLVYGPGYGLLYDSAPGRFTRVTIRIPREEAEHV